jgi:hypothetical protein
VVTRRSVIKAAGAGTLASGLSTSAVGAAQAAEAADVLVVVEKSSHAVGFYDVADLDDAGIICQLSCASSARLPDANPPLRNHRPLATAP